MHVAMAWKKTCAPAEQYVSAQHVSMHVSLSFVLPVSADQHDCWLAAVQVEAPPDELPLLEPLLDPLLLPLELPLLLPLLLPDELLPELLPDPELPPGMSPVSSGPPLAHPTA